MTNGEVNLGPIKFKLTRASVVCFCALAVVAAGAWVWSEFLYPVLRPGTADIPYSQLVQFEEAQRHFGETPVVLGSTGDLTAGDFAQVYAYQHDATTCIAVRRTYGLGSVTEFVIDPRRIFEEDVSVAGVLGTPPKKCDGECLDPHPGAPLRTETADEEDECVLWIWWDWPDGCRLHQRWNHCEKVWVDEEPVPDCCIH